LDASLPSGVSVTHLNINLSNGPIFRGPSRAAPGRAATRHDLVKNEHARRLNLAAAANSAAPVAI